MKAYKETHAWHHGYRDAKIGLKPQYETKKAYMEGYNAYLGALATEREL